MEKRRSTEKNRADADQVIHQEILQQDLASSRDSWFKLRLEQVRKEMHSGSKSKLRMVISRKSGLSD